MRRIKKTKIIATLGPSTSSRDSIEMLIKEEVYNYANKPLIIGKTDEHNNPLIPGYGELTADDLSKIIFNRYAPRLGVESDNNKINPILKSKLESKPILHSNEQESIAAMFHKTMIDVYTLVNTSPKETCGIIDKRCSYNAELHTPPGSPPSSADVMTSFGFKQYSPPATETCKTLTKSVRLCNC